MADSPPSDPPRIVLLLQGGGALGAFQGGVYQALEENDYAPDWVIGTSIGAVNAALIAGNPVGERIAALRAFWDRISSADFETFLPPWLRHLRLSGHLNATRVKMVGEAGFFAPRTFMGLNAHNAETASVYSTRPLLSTLKRHIDFDCLNNSDVRVSVGASSVTRGQLRYFDNSRERLGPRHILASGSLPPGFPAVRIGDDVFWDGGLCSNTPLEEVFHDSPHTSSLCFAINLWNARGAEPASLLDVLARKKEIGYSSRFDDAIDVFKDLHTLRNAVSTLFDALPEGKRRQERFKALGDMGSSAHMDVVRLGRRAHDWELATKDIDFSRAIIDEHWARGYRDARRALERAPWWRDSSTHRSVVIHDFD